MHGQPPYRLLLDLLVRFQRLAIILLLVLATLLGGVVALLRAAEQQIAQKLQHRLEGTDFQLDWQSLSLSMTGRLELNDLRLHDAETRTDVLTAGQVQANVALWSSLFGQKRLHGLRLADVHLRLDVADGRADTLERLQKALQKQKDPDETTQKIPLLLRLGNVEVADLTADVSLTTAAGLEWKTQIHAAGSANFSEPTSQWTAQLDENLGRGKVTVALEHPEGKVTSLRLVAEPPVQVTAQVVVAKAPANWLISLHSAALERQKDGWQVVLGRLALGPQAQPLLQVEEVKVDVQRLVQLRHLNLAIPLRLLPEKAGKLLETLGLTGDLTATVAQVELEKTAEGGAHVDVQGVQARLGALLGQVQNVHGELADRHHPQKLENWRLVQVNAPSLTLPMDAPQLVRQPHYEELQQLALLRKPADEPDEEEDSEMPSPDAIPDLPATEDDPRTPPPKGEKHKERPSVRWTRKLNALHERLFGLYDKLGALWPDLHALDALRLDVRDGSVQLLDNKGRALLGVREGRLTLLPPEKGVRRLSFGAEPFDSAGSWGHIGATWQREGHGHRLDVRLSGAGLAQWLALKAKGLALEQSADIELLATLRLPDADHLDVSGRLAVDHMGIHWWRLADRPIADLRLHMPFELHALRHPGTLRLSSPDVYFGGSNEDAVAHLTFVLDLTQLDNKPKIRVDIDAPPQDAGEMLHAIPPSMLPTIGRIDAHGPLAWHFGLIVPLASTGASFVDLSLGDTLCVMDKFGSIDLAELNGEFDRPVNENGTILDDVHIGPATDEWTDLSEIPPYVTFAMWASEDSFFRHRGISESLISKALSIDLSYGRFIYGGSTVTQQLVKNLYLVRTKALSRKFEEMLIAWQMEKVLGKQRILEIYLNAVEFGPKIYGITRAAWAFFGKLPEELTPKEGVYLAIIKPSPRSGYATARGNGWGEWYDMKVTKYMDRLLEEGFISQAEYDAEKPFKPKFDVQKP